MSFEHDTLSDAFFAKKFDALAKGGRFGLTSVDINRKNLDKKSGNLL